MSSYFLRSRASFRLRTLDLIPLSMKPSFPLGLFAAFCAARVIVMFLKRNVVGGRLPTNPNLQVTVHFEIWMQLFTVFCLLFGRVLITNYSERSRLPNLMQPRNHSI